MCVLSSLFGLPLLTYPSNRPSCQRQPQQQQQQGDGIDSRSGSSRGSSRIIIISSSSSSSSCVVLDEMWSSVRWPQRGRRVSARRRPRLHPVEEVRGAFRATSTRGAARRLLPPTPTPPLLRRRPTDRPTDDECTVCTLVSGPGQQPAARSVPPTGSQQVCRFGSAHPFHRRHRGRKEGRKEGRKDHETRRWFMKSDPRLFDAVVAAAPSTRDRRETRARHRPGGGVRRLHWVERSGAASGLLSRREDATRQVGRPRRGTGRGHVTHAAIRARARARHSQ
jgi:hypothetical protein